MSLISNLILSIKDGSTIASTEIYGVKTYVNIGSGNVFKLEWETPILTNDTVDRYSLVVKRYDPTLEMYYDIFNKNVGQVNEFYVDSPMLPIAPQYMLSIYLVAYSKYGSVITSNTLTPYVIKGSGTYVKVKEEDYAEAIMKRALSFVNTRQSVASSLPLTAPDILTNTAGQTLVDADEKVLLAKSEPVAVPGVLTDSEGYILLDSDGKLLCPIVIDTVALLNRTGNQFIDSTGRSLFAPTTVMLSNINGWDLVQQSYTKNTAGTWSANDITYEVFQVRNEAGKYEALTDSTSKPIYIL